MTTINSLPQPIFILCVQDTINSFQTQKKCWIPKTDQWLFSLLHNLPLSFEIFVEMVSIWISTTLIRIKNIVSGLQPPSNMTRLGCAVRSPVRSLYHQPIFWIQLQSFCCSPLSTISKPRLSSRAPQLWHRYCGDSVGNWSKLSLHRNCYAC